MKKLMILLVAVCLGLCAAAEGPLRVSLFLDIVDVVAKEQGVSFERAVEILKEAGVGGFDANYASPKLSRLEKTCLKPINLYGFMNFKSADGGAKEIAAFVDTAVKYGVPRIMAVPDSFSEDGDREAEFRRICAGMRALVAAAAAKGVTVTVEDFGGTANPCSYAGYVKRFLTEIPDLCFALDSGNQYYAGRGDDIREMIPFAGGRIRHVHLKDQTREDNHRYATLGLGAVPNADVVREVRRLGYDGWYTLENPVGPDHLADIHRQLAVLRYWCGK